MPRAQSNHYLTATRCDSCRIYFLTDNKERYVYPCGHVYCHRCHGSMQPDAREFASVRCSVKSCLSFLTRGNDGCEHQIQPAVFAATQWKDPLNPPVLDPHFQVRCDLPDQTVDRSCLSCHLYRCIFEETHDLADQFSMVPFVPGCQVYTACVVHGGQGHIGMSNSKGTWQPEEDDLEMDIVDSSYVAEVTGEVRRLHKRHAAEFPYNPYVAGPASMIPGEVNRKFEHVFFVVRGRGIKEWLANGHPMPKLVKRRRIKTER